MPVTESLLDHKVLGREFKRGLAVGLKQGRHKGQVRFLRRGLERRFKKLPKWVADKLTTATPAQIEEWGKRLLEEKSLAAIFGQPQK